MTDPDLGPEIEDARGDQTPTLTPVRRERGETRRRKKRKRNTRDGKEAEVDREDETDDNKLLFSVFVLSRHLMFLHFYK